MKGRFVFFLLAVLLAVAASWGLSFMHPHSMRLPGGYGLRCDRGTVQLRHEHETDLAVDAANRITVVDVAIGAGKNAPHRFGLHGVPVQLSPWRPYSVTWVGSGGFVTLPGGKQAHLGYKVDVWGVAHWVLAVPLLLLSGWLVARAWRHRRRRNPAACTSCGYDLRATPQRCPECGTVPEVSAGAAA